MVLTDKETLLMKSIVEGMDEPGCGWLDQLNPFNNDKVCAGVLSSLIQKGLVHSYEDREGPMVAYWITLV